MNSICVLGTIMSEPGQIFVGAKQKPYSSFTLAVSRGYKMQDGKPAVDFLQIRAFGTSSNYFKNYCKKFDMLFVQGRMQTDKYITKEGKPGYVTYIFAEKLGAAGYSRNKVYRLFGLDVRQQIAKEQKAARAAAAAAEKEAAARKSEENGSEADLGAIDW